MTDSEAERRLAEAMRETRAHAGTDEEKAKAYLQAMLEADSRLLEAAAVIGVRRVWASQNLLQ